MGHLIRFCCCRCRRLCCCFTQRLKRRLEGQSAAANGSAQLLLQLMQLLLERHILGPGFCC
jgi:hypothetical protein